MTGIDPDHRFEPADSLSSRATRVPRRPWGIDMPKLNAFEQFQAWRHRYPAPCQAACPVHTDVRSYVTLTASGRFDEAFAAARGPNPFSSVCGRACSAPCEDICTRREFDRPLRIRQIKRFLTDRYQAHAVASPNPVTTGMRVGVVGAGPAGLSAAHDLAMRGHAVTVYEAAKEPGGMALLGVPRFRLAHEAIARDIESIRELGVEIRTGVRIGRDVSLAKLREAHHAVFIAAGAMRSNPLDVPGADLPGVIQSLPFLEEANLGGRPACGAEVAVIGGGYTAMDAARTAVRLGARRVTVLYRRTRAETEVHEDELEDTLREGVQIEYLTSPLRMVEGADGRVAGVRCIRNRLGEADASGRPRPVPIDGSEFVFPADTVILALGQQPDPASVDGALGPVLREANAATLMTPEDGVFAGGDFVTGAATIIEAVAQGQAAATAIHDYLTVRHGPPGGWPPAPRAEIVAEERRVAGLAMRGGEHGLALDLEAEMTMDEREAMADGLRCLYCGLEPSVIFDLCTACQACAIICPMECIHRVVLEDDGTTRPATGFGEFTVYEIDAQACIYCGRCFKACPTGAITVGVGEGAAAV